MTVVAVTGASGFVGRRLCDELTRRGHIAVGIVRHASKPLHRSVGELTGATNWEHALEGVEVIVHCAARTHVLREQVKDPLPLYRVVNVDGTRRLAEEAARLGVRRVVYLSSVKAAAERSVPGRPLRLSDVPAPEDAYGISKLEAEAALLTVSAMTGLETSIVRPPLVYGPGVKGNFLRLLGAISRGCPLPLSGADNQRSLVALPNLIDFVSNCVVSPAAAGRIFFVSDGEDLSTETLARRLGKALGKPARLFRVEKSLLRRFSKIVGRSGEIDRLLGTLQVDLSDATKFLSWSPPFSVDDGLCETATWYKTRSGGSM